MAKFQDLFSLEGRTVLVTGPTRGIGLAIARLFADAGARLILAGIEAEACDRLAEELDAISVPTDVSDFRALRHLVATGEDHGGVDVLVCNAGIAGSPGPMHEADAQERTRLFAINLEHPIILSGLVASSMARRGRGSIILLSSIAGLRGNAALGLYGITKAGLAQLARNLAVEWGPSGVRANAIAPGLIDTEWAQAITGHPEAKERRLVMTPLRRTGDPLEIAATALFLASDAGGFITGQTIVADGGTLITDGN